MATIELIAELHEIKESICAAVRNVREFNIIQLNMRYTNRNEYGKQVLLATPIGKSWTEASNTIKQFERLINLCGTKGNIFDINVKKFELKEKIPICTNTEIRCTDERQVIALYTRFTTLIGMIPIKKVYVKKVVIKKELEPTTPPTPPTPVVAKISPTIQTPLKTPKSEEEQQLKPKTPQNTLNPKTKTHQISLENYEIRALKQSDCLLQINNLSEFANVQFYFHKSQYNELYLHYKGHAQYLIGNDHKLYVINGVRLVQGIHYDKLQCWTL